MAQNPDPQAPGRGTPAVSATRTSTGSAAARVLRALLRYGVPLAISAGLVVWLLRKVDLDRVVDIARHGCDYRWIAVMMGITVLSHIARGIRWGIQLRAVGIPRMSWLAYSVSIFGAYALNLVFPQLGEAWRCVYMSRKGHAPLSSVVGTDIGDRGSDAVVVGLLMILCLVVAHPEMMRFMTHYSLGRDFDRIVDDPWVWCCLALLLTAVWILFHAFRGYRLVRRIEGAMANVWHGFRVLFTMRGTGMYLVLTLAIWTCYYLETYVCFFAFPFTRDLVTDPGTAWGLIPGLVVFVFGSFSMAVPSNGGLGPWNIAVMFALSLYAVNSAEGTAFSIVMWGSQAAMLIALGIFSAIYIACTRRKGLPAAPAAS